MEGFTKSTLRAQAGSALGSGVGRTIKESTVLFEKNFQTTENIVCCHPLAPSSPMGMYDLAQVAKDR